MDMTILSALSTDKVAGIGILKSIREKENTDKSGTFVSTSYFLEVSKLNASLTLRMNQEQFTRVTAFIANESWHLNQTLLKYEAGLGISSDAFSYGEGKAMAVGKYDTPQLTSIDVVK